ncbi:hypothetical protein M885DRAFT_520398 [Pelagophyceae sp. CCMP2097]|nr:hypothetical protein M885DRAFT_520398 [Pelagophyceae sp. CCMP2097]
MLVLSNDVRGSAAGSMCMCVRKASVAHGSCRGSCADRGAAVRGGGAVGGGHSATSEPLAVCGRRTGGALRRCDVPPAARSAGARAGAGQGAISVSGGAVAVSSPSVSVSPSSVAKNQRPPRQGLRTARATWDASEFCVSEGLRRPGSDSTPRGRAKFDLRAVMPLEVRIAISTIAEEQTNLMRNKT